MDLFTFFLVVCLPIIFYAYLVDRRRKRSAREFSEHLAVLTARIYKLEKLEEQAKHAAAAAVQPGSAPTQPVPVAAAAPKPAPPPERPAPAYVPPVIHAPAPPPPAPTQQPVRVE